MDQKAKRERVSIMLSRDEAVQFRDLLVSLQGTASPAARILPLVRRLEKMALRAIELHLDRQEKEVMESIAEVSEIEAYKREGEWIE